MTVLNPPIAIQALATHAADDHRGALAAGFTSMGGGTTPRPRAGVLPGWGAELAVGQRGAGANMSVDVGAGKAMIPAPTNGHGGWVLINDAVLNLVIAANGAGNPRTDLVIARVSDAQYHTGGTNDAAVEVITGTAGVGAPVPTVPVAKGAYIVLARVAVAAGAASITNANITLNTVVDVPRTAALGGVLIVANSTQRNAINPHAGLVVYQADTGVVYKWIGTAWRTLDNLQPGALAEYPGSFVNNGGITDTIPMSSESEWGASHSGGVFTAPEAGIYQLNGYVKQTPTAAPHHGSRAYFGLNGTTQLGRVEAYAGDNSLAANQSLNISDLAILATNDTVRLCVQGIGGQTTILAARMSVQKVRD